MAERIEREERPDIAALAIVVVYYGRAAYKREV
jgi:hypothetical protein